MGIEAIIGVVAVALLVVFVAYRVGATRNKPTTSGGGSSTKYPGQDKK